MADVTELVEKLRRRARVAVRDAGDRTRAKLVAETPSLKWVYGHDPRQTFLPHLRLDGRTFENWEDPALAAGGFPPVPRYFPGDHAGCLCADDVVLGPPSKSATSWRVSYTDDGRRFVARFENRRYDGALLRRPAPYVPVARRGGGVVRVRARAQVPDRVAFFWRERLSLQQWHANLAISLAVG